MELFNHRDLIDLSDIPDDSLEYIEVQVMMEFTILVESSKADVVRQQLKTVEEPTWTKLEGVGDYMVAVNPTFEKAVKTLDKIKEIRVQIKLAPTDSYQLDLKIWNKISIPTLLNKNRKSLGTIALT